MEGEKGEQAGQSNSTENLLRHHRNLWEGKEGGESESEEEGRATAEGVEGTHRPFGACRHFQRSRYGGEEDGVSVGDAGTQSDSSSIPHDWMVGADKDEAAGLNFVDSLCESEEEESEDGEANGGDGKPA